MTGNYKIYSDWYDYLTGFIAIHGDGEGADSIRNEMDEYWNKLTEEEQSIFETSMKLKQIYQNTDAFSE